MFLQRPLCLRFKLLNQRKVATLVSGEPNETRHNCVETEKLSPSRLLYVAGKHYKCNCLIDTGAAVSVLPRSCANGTVDADSLILVAANNSVITTYDTSKRIVDVGLKREYSWTFIVADVNQPILGADFLIYSLQSTRKFIRQMPARHENRTGDISHLIFN